MNLTWKELFSWKSPLPWFLGFIICFVVWYIRVFVVSNHPSRPNNVPKSATLVYSMSSYFWQECWFDSTSQTDNCRIYNRGGLVLREGVYLPVDGGPALHEDQLKLASKEQLKTLPGGGPFVVRLANGVTLIPQDGFEGYRRELNGDFSDTK